MTNTERIQANNAELREAIELAESLPDAGTGGSVVPWLKGYTDEITPQQVADALTEDRDVLLGYTHPQYGTIWFTSFNMSVERETVFTSGVVNIDNVWTVFQLDGRVGESSWRSYIVPLATQEDVPTVPTTEELVAAVIAALPKYGGEVADA